MDIIALKKQLIIFLKKAEVFYQKYKENFNEINKVQLLFFYDSVRKKGYEGIIQNTKNFKWILWKKTFIPADNLELKFISILSSYFAIADYDWRVKIKSYEVQAKELQGRVNFLYEEIQKMKVENETLSDKIEKMKKSNKTLFNNLKAENKIQSDEMEKMQKGNETLFNNLKAENKTLFDEMEKMKIANNDLCLRVKASEKLLNIPDS